jgi:Xaa-Pro aminopeptidase
MSANKSAAGALAFDTRLRRVRDGLASEGLDALFAYKLVGETYAYGGHGYVRHLTDPWLTFSITPVIIFVPLSGEVVCILLGGLGVSVGEGLRVLTAPMEGMVRNRAISLFSSLRDVVSDAGLQHSRIGVVLYDDLPLWIHSALHKELPDVRFDDATALMDRSMAVKSPYEVAEVAETARLADLAFETVFEVARPGVSERDAAVEAEYRVMREGATSAHIRVGSGTPRVRQSSDRPASSKLIEVGDHLHVNMDLLRGGYWANVTRRGVAGKASADYRLLFDLVIQMEDAGLEAMRVGATGHDVHAAVNRVVQSAVSRGIIGDYEFQRLGHAIGLENQERPFLVPADQMAIVEDMTFALHPGLQVPGRGHVSNGDIVQITSSGSRLLTQFPRKLQERE